MKIDNIIGLLNTIQGPFIVLFVVVAALFTLAPEQKATILSGALGVGSTMIQLQKTDRDKDGRGSGRLEITEAQGQFTVSTPDNPDNSTSEYSDQP